MWKSNKNEDPDINELEWGLKALFNANEQHTDNRMYHQLKLDPNAEIPTQYDEFRQLRIVREMKEHANEEEFLDKKLVQLNASFADRFDFAEGRNWTFRNNASIVFTSEKDHPKKLYLKSIFPHTPAKVSLQNRSIKYYTQIAVWGEPKIKSPYFFGQKTAFSMQGNEILQVKWDLVELAYFYIHDKEEPNIKL